MKFLAIVLLFFFPSMVYSEVTCHNAQPEELACGPVTVPNQIGSVLTISTNFNTNVCARFSDIDVRTTASGINLIGPIVAQVPNETVWFVWRTPTQVVSNWSCSMTVKVNGRVPLTGAQKDVHRQNGEAANQWGDAFFGIAAGLAFSGNTAAAVIVGVSGQALKIISSREQGIANDPWDPDYMTPYEPAWLTPEDLGMSWISDTSDDVFYYWGNEVIRNALLVEMLGITIYVTNNRANSCLQVANLDCNDWQIERGKYFLRWLGSVLSDISYDFAVLEGKFDPASEVFNALDQVRIITGDAGWTYQQ